MSDDRDPDVPWLPKYRQARRGNVAVRCIWIAVAVGAVVVFLFSSSDVRVIDHIPPAFHGRYRQVDFDPDVAEAGDIPTELVISKLAVSMVFFDDGDGRNLVVRRVHELEDGSIVTFSDLMTDTGILPNFEMRMQMRFTADGLLVLDDIQTQPHPRRGEVVRFWRLGVFAKWTN